MVSRKDSTSSAELPEEGNPFQTVQGYPDDIQLGGAENWEGYVTGNPVEIKALRHIS